MRFMIIWLHASGKLLDEAYLKHSKSEAVLRTNSRQAVFYFNGNKHQINTMNNLEERTKENKHDDKLWLKYLICVSGPGP